jgi:HlyD family secretion protein
MLQLASERREEAATQLRDIGFNELELAERRRSLSEQVERLDIRAPVSGVVLGLAVTTPRSVIRPADPVLYIIPQDRPLVIAAQVPTIHIDQVHVGQPARLMFSAFSSRTTEELQGNVVQVAADATTERHRDRQRRHGHEGSCARNARRTFDGIRLRRARRHADAGEHQGA